MILVIACLCSCPELVTIEAHGLEFSAEELLFLSKTFESARSGSLQIERDEGYDALCITNIFERELLNENDYFQAYCNKNLSFHSLVVFLFFTRKLNMFRFLFDLEQMTDTRWLLDE